MCIRDRSKEGKLISVMIGILEEVGLSIEDLEENALALGEEIDTISDDLADVESVVYGEDEEDVYKRQMASSSSSGTRWISSKRFSV